MSHTRASLGEETLKIVTGRLDAAAIPYMVTGSMALNYYAVPRMTRDIDIVVEASAADADRLCELFRDDFYLDPEAVREAVERHGVFNLIHVRLVVKVESRSAEARRAPEYGVQAPATGLAGGSPLVIVGPEDLVISKLDWASESRSAVQLADARNLLESVPKLDRAYLEHWAARLGLEAIYREVAHERHAARPGGEVPGDAACAFERGAAEDGGVHVRDHAGARPR